jgi:hypothetical protein
VGLTGGGDLVAHAADALLVHALLGVRALYLVVVEPLPVLPRESLVVAAQVEIESKIEAKWKSFYPYFSFKHLVIGAFNVRFRG